MKLLLATLLTLCTVCTQAQDTTRVEQYCDVTATPRLLSAKVTIDVDYGDERSIWRDNRIKDEGGRLKKFNTVMDALNYMGKQGWKLVHVYPVISPNNPTVYHYIFKKEFLPSELNE